MGPILKPMCGLVGEEAEDLQRLVTTTRFQCARQTSQTGSTNADVSACARSGADEGLVLVADEQTAGRGRRNRQWASPGGKSLAMSLLLRPTLRDEGWGWLSLLAGMAVTLGLRSLSDEPARIALKWPNDVLIDGDKVCGILSERVETPRGPAAVVGIGINLTLERDELPVVHSTSLALAGMAHGRDEVAAAVVVAFDRLYTQWLGSGPPLDDYSRLCASIGASLTIIVSDDEQVSGVGVGIDTNGRLVVNVAGELRPFAVGDVVHARLG